MFCICEKLLKVNKNWLIVLFLCFTPLLYLKANPEKTEEFLKNHKLINKEIRWDKLEINNKKNSENLIWRKIEVNEFDEFENQIKVKQTQQKDSRSKSVLSFNRSVVFNDNNVGPDITFLVPIGFKSKDGNFLDISLRGWNRRHSNTSLFAWNGGDAVSQILYQFINKEKSTFGLNFGIRSIYSGNLPGGKTDIGEGISAGFRWDYKLGDNIGFAIGAEQLVHFDETTDTGRDIYLSLSKAFFKTNNDENLPFFILTGGLGTGYLALWENTKFACSDLFGGAAVDLSKYHQLCWGPFGAVSLVLNERIATFLEYNNYSFMVGASVNPKSKLRLTLGAIIAESYDDYKLKNFDNMRLFGRLSFGF